MQSTIFMITFNRILSMNGTLTRKTHVTSRSPFSSLPFQQSMALWKQIEKKRRQKLNFITKGQKALPSKKNGFQSNLDSVFFFCLLLSSNHSYVYIRHDIWSWSSHIYSQFPTYDIESLKWWWCWWRCQKDYHRLICIHDMQEDDSRVQF